LAVLVLSAATLLPTLAGCGPKVRPDLPPDADHVAKIRTGLVGGGGDSSAEGEAAAAAQQPTGWATLRGNFVLAGTAPPRQPLNVNKETEVCAPGGIQVLSEQLVVGSSGEIKDVVVYLTSKIPDDEPWTHPTAKPGNTEPVVFDQKECIFLTHVLAMQVSQPLRILNSDPIGHNTNLSPRSNPGFNQIIPSGTPGVTYQPTSEESAPFPVACSIHPWMGAQMLIRKNGYFAVTAEDGSFEIPNLPAGVELEFRVWQEKTKFVQDVTVNGEATKWNKGRFVLTLDPADQSQNELKVEVSL
jgi:predicted small lipoprotein YifL